MKKLIITIIISLTVGFAWANPAQIQKEIDQTAWFNQVLESAKGGDAQAQANLALAYGRGYGTKPDHKLALEWARKSAKQGNLDGLEAYFRGQELKKMPFSKENLELIEKVKILAEKGKIKAQLTLGLIYYFGAHNEKKERDLKSALKWYEKAYAQDNKDLQLSIEISSRLSGLLYEIHLDDNDLSKVDENIKKRIFNLTKYAADGGPIGGLENARNASSDAVGFMAIYYREGIGCKQNLLESIKYAYQGAIFGDDFCLEFLKKTVNDLENYLKSKQ